MFNQRARLVRRSTSIALLLFAAAAGAASAQVKPATPAAARVAAVQPSDPPDYVIGPEDVLDIAVWDNTQMSRTVSVRPDGKISLPLLNDVKAAGETAMQLRGELTTALARFMPDPVVSVIVRDIHSFKVTVIGEVKQPGREELHSRSTVLDALAMAGGFTEYAKRGRIMVLRRRGTTTYSMPFAFDEIAAGNLSGQPNFDLQPGDIILVP